MNTDFRVSWKCKIWAGWWRWRKANGGRWTLNCYTKWMMVQYSFLTENTRMELWNFRNLWRFVSQNLPDPEFMWLKCSVQTDLYHKWEFPFPLYYHFFWENNYVTIDQYSTACDHLRMFRQIFSYKLLSSCTRSIYGSKNTSRIWRGSWRRMLCCFLSLKMLHHAPTCNP